MLSAMRRNAKSPFIKILLLAVAASFIIGFGAFTYVSGYLGKGNKTAFFMKVNGTEISFNEYMNEVRNRERRYRQMFGDQFEQIAANLNLESQAQEALIDNILLRDYADEIGLKVSNEELRRHILEYPAFQRNGVFNREVYETLLRKNNLTPKDFELGQRQALITYKMNNLLSETVKVSKQEVWDDYALNATKAKFRYVTFDAKQYEGKAEVTDEEAAAYYEQHSEEFRVDETRRGKIVQFNPDDFSEDVNVETADIEDYYQQNLESQFTDPEQVKASHILRRLPKDASEEVRQATQELADDILRRAREGADFAELAKKFSEDPSNKEKGGDLGFFPRGRMEKGFEDLAFSLDKGEVGGLATTSYGFHIIKVFDKTAARVKPLDEVKVRITDTLVREKTGAFAEAAARDTKTSLTKDKSLSELADEKGMSVILTDLVARSEAVKELDGGWQLTSTLFTLEENQISEPIKGLRSWYLVELVNVEPEHVPAFEQVAEEVIKKVQKEKEIELAKMEAEKFLKEISPETSLPILAESKSMTVSETSLLTLRGDRIDNLGSSREVKDAIFGLTRKDPLAKEPYAIGNKVVVFELIDRQEPTEEGFATVEDDLAQKLKRQKGNERYRIWKEQARAEASIQINTGFLEK